MRSAKTCKQTHPGQQGPQFGSLGKWNVEADPLLGGDLLAGGVRHVRSDNGSSDSQRSSSGSSDAGISEETAARKAKDTKE